MPTALTFPSVCGNYLLMRGVRPKLLVCLSLWPFLMGASDAGHASIAPQSCPGLPVDEPFIGGLVDGQALVSGQSVTLQFSNVALTCGESLTSISSEGCRSQWTFSLTLPITAIQPGTYSLSALSAQFSELFGNAGVEQGGGCSNSYCPMHVFGTGYVPLIDASGTLEIYSADDGCITGNLAGFEDPVFPEAPDHNGAFFALRCSH